MEIKFRGQRIDTKEWVYGYFVKAWDGTCYIITEFGSNVTCCDECGANAITVHEVIPETVGQYTGLKDKNGVEIYEGDILRTPVGNAIVKFGESEHNGFYHYGFYLTFIIRDQDDTYRHDFGYWYTKSKVIGNIHDNPELLKGVE